MVGSTIDRKYKLLRLLGEGGMGAVYEAEHQGTCRRVAVKVMNSRLLAPGSEGAPRFRREARTAGALESDNIVAVLDAGADEATGALYLVMERLQGEDLQSLIDRIGPLPPDVALRVAAQALAGLSRAHDAGVVHRDIKPANLYLAQGRGGAITVKLLDFGIAKIKADPLAAPHTAGLTTTGGFLGSPLYMSPEQVVSSRDVDARSDLWSLASALYCALSGRAPHGHIASVGRLILAICAGPPPPLREVAPWVPEEVAAVVHGALALKPEERYPSAEAMLAAIRPLLPDGAVLREEMRLSLHAERAGRAPLSAARVVADLGATRTIDGEIDGEEDAAPNDAAARTEDRTVMLDEPRAGVEPALIPAQERPAAPALVAHRVTRPETRVEGERVVRLDTTTQGHEAPTKGPAEARAARTRGGASRAWAWAGAVLALGLLARAYQGLSRPIPAPSPSAAISPAGPPSSQSSPLGAPSAAPLPPPLASAPEVRRRVRLVIAPRDASVEIDGARVPVDDGAVILHGTLGSSHRVSVVKGSRKIERLVFMKEEGAEPPRIDLAATAPLAPPAPRAPPTSREDPLMP